MSSYYIQRKPTADDPTPDIIDIEATFEGIYINEIENLLGKGEIKNRYIETFADRAEPKIYNPPKEQGILHNPTNVSIVFTAFADGNAEGTPIKKFIKAYIDFLAFVSDREFTLWDDLRNVKAELILTAAVSPDDIFTSGQECLNEVTVEFQNLKGTFEELTLEP